MLEVKAFWIFNKIHTLKKQVNDLEQHYKSNNVVITRLKFKPRSDANTNNASHAIDLAKETSSTKRQAESLLVNQFVNSDLKNDI